MFRTSAVSLVPRETQHRVRGKSRITMVSQNHPSTSTRTGRRPAITCNPRSCQSHRLVIHLLIVTLSASHFAGASCFTSLSIHHSTNQQTAAARIMSLRKNKNRPSSSGSGRRPISRGGASSSSSFKLAPTVFDNSPFWQAQSVFLGANVLGYLVSLLTNGSHIHLDLLGTGAFAAAAAVVPLTAQAAATPRRVHLSAVAVFAWGFKLASFLFYRALITKHDNRLDGVNMSSFWIVSLVWGAVCSLPHTLGTTSSAFGNPHMLKFGSATYVVGLVTETLADLQKWQFKKSLLHSSNGGASQFCNVGLWSISQHPNFFGNLLVWSGILLMNATALVGATGSPRRYLRLALAGLSPLFMLTLFYGQASGAIMNSVELATAKYGHDPSYQEYIQTVPLIVPNPFQMLLRSNE